MPGKRFFRILSILLLTVFGGLLVVMSFKSDGQKRLLLAYSPGESLGYPSTRYPYPPPLAPSPQFDVIPSSLSIEPAVFLPAIYSPITINTEDYILVETPEFHLCTTARSLCLDGHWLMDEGRIEFYYTFSQGLIAYMGIVWTGYSNILGPIRNLDQQIGYLRFGLPSKSCIEPATAEALPWEIPTTLTLNKVSGSIYYPQSVDPLGNPVIIFPGSVGVSRGEFSVNRLDNFMDCTEQVLVGNTKSEVFVVKKLAWRHEVTL